MPNLFREASEKENTVEHSHGVVIRTVYDIKNKAGPIAWPFFKQDLNQNIIQLATGLKGSVLGWPIAYKIKVNIF